mgnify:FL=1
MLNRESYEKNRSHLPEHFTEKILEGGCHGQFGSYGVQKGDGTPTITQQEQVEETVEDILAFVQEGCDITDPSGRM